MNEYKSPLARKEHSRRPQVLALLAGGLFYAFTRMKRMDSKIPELNDRDWLYQQYVVDGKTDRMIAEELGRHTRTICNRRMTFGIPGRLQNAKMSCRCSSCGASLMRRPSDIVRAKHLFCSVGCRAAWQRKHTHGKNSYSWRGGATVERGKWLSNGGHGWKRACRKRDNYTCQRCGEVFDKRSNALQVHHKASFADYPELRSNKANGISLCRQCHEWIHSNEGALVRLRWEQDAVGETTSQRGDGGDEAAPVKREAEMLSAMPA